MGGIFGDLDVASAADDPFKLPPNVYEATVTDVKVGDTQDGSKTGMTITYTVSTDDEHDGKSVREWKQIPRPADPKNPAVEDKKAMSWLKARLLDLGIPESRINSVTPDDLIGKEVTITVAEGKNPSFMNVNRVTLRQDVSAVTSGKKKFA